MNGEWDAFEAVRAGDDKGLRALLRRQPGLASERRAGVSLLMAALYQHRRDLADIVLGARPELDVFEAAALGEREIIVELLRAGGAVSQRSPDGYTALHLAAYFAHPTMVDRLLRRGADVDAVADNDTRVCPLHSAVAGGSRDAVRVLLAAGADPNARQHGGWTALHATAQRGDRETSRLLVEAGADLELTNDEGKTPLDIAREAGHKTVL
jgi:ankyrin repeat protein